MEKLPLDRLDGAAARRLAEAAGGTGPALERTGSGGISGAAEQPQARLLMTQPGVGPITSLAFVLTIGDVSRFSTTAKWPVIWA